MTTVEVQGRQLQLTNLEKVLYPASGFTKAQVIAYYLEVAPVLLEHLAGRPLTTRRFPDGVEGASWHQNESSGEPEWFPVFETTGRSGRTLRFTMVDGTASLVWLANRAALELHPFQWRVELPRQPLAMIFDLDPGPPAGLLEAARVALCLRDLLAELELTALVKSSGLLGLHLHVPLEQPGRRRSLRAGSRRRWRSAIRTTSWRRCVASFAPARCTSTGSRTTRPVRRSRPTRCAAHPGRRSPLRSRGTRSRERLRSSELSG